MNEYKLKSSTNFILYQRNPLEWTLVYTAYKAKLVNGIYPLLDMTGILIDSGLLWWPSTQWSSKDGAVGP